MPRRPRLIRIRTRLAWLAAAATALVISGCAGPLQVDAGQGGSDPACRQVLDMLPSTLAGASERETSGGAGSAAWGDPAIVLRCGVEPIGVTTMPCVSVAAAGADEVDWIVIASDDTGSIVQTYGREPAVQVEVPSQYGPAPVSVLPDLTAAVTVIAATAVCVQ